MGDGIEEGKTTYHGKDGRFTRSRSAHTVTRSGERFKMIRQLRRISAPRAPEPPPEAPEDEAPTEEAMEAQRSLRGILAASPGWTTLHSVTEAVFGKGHADFEPLGEVRGDDDTGKLSKVKKKFEPHMIVISKDSGGNFIVTMGDPRKPTSKLIARETTKNDIRWWVKDNVGGKYGRYSHDHVYDATKLKLSPPVYSQWYVDNIMG